LLSSSTIAVLLLVSSPWLAREVYDNEQLLPILAVFALALPAAAVLRVGAAATRVSQDLRASVVIEDFGQPFVFAVIAAAFLWRGGSVVAASVASALSFLLMGIAAWIWAHRWFPHAARGEAETRPVVSLSGLVRYSVPTALAGTVGVTMTWLDRLLVGYYLPTEAVGWYQVAAQVSGAFAVVLGAFAAIFTPMIAGLLERGEEDRLQELFRVATKWGALAVLPGATLCLLFPRASLGAIFGADYLPAAAPLVILVLGQLVHAGIGAVGYLLMMSGSHNLWLGLSAAALAADCVLNVALIPRYGLRGAAIATAVSVAVLFVSGLIAVRRRLGLWPYDRRFLGVLATAACVLGGTALLHTIADLGDTATVVSAAALSGALTLGGWRLFCFRAEDRLLLGKLRRFGR
ncbi:MAG: oligosaccharide flippase family protein, partial [Acidobacteria bacterium]|nr:oligosaccharide flippase family protein [Acidobacteriota bacterium]